MPPSTGVLDNFNRADESPLGASWTAVSTGFGKPNLTSNVLQYPQGSYRDCCWNTSFVGDQEIYYTVPATVTSKFLEIFARITNPNSSNLNAYNVEINTTTGGWTLSTVLKNSYKSIGTGTKAVAAGDKVWLKCEGTSIKAIHIASGGTETTVISVTNSAVTGSGQIGCGLQSGGANLTIDNFGGGALSTGTAITLGQASETDTAQGVSRAKTRSAGQSSESDSAQAVTPQKARRLGQPLETDTALPVAVQKTCAVGQAAETEQAHAIASAKVKAVGEAASTEAAQQVTPKKTVHLGQATETEIAGSTAPAKSLSLGQAEESNEAQPLSPQGQLVVPAGQAAESETALPISVLKSLTLGQAQEASIAQGATILKRLVILQAQESDQALAMMIGPGGRVVLLRQAVEVDEALPLIRLLELAQPHQGRVNRGRAGRATGARSGHGVLSRQGDIQ